MKNLLYCLLILSIVSTCCASDNNKKEKKHAKQLSREERARQALDAAQHDPWVEHPLRGKSEEPKKVHQANPLVVKTKDEIDG